MKKIRVWATVMLCACFKALAIQPLPANKPLDANNPICPIYFCADATAVVYNGRVYVYGSNDQQEFDESGDTGNNSYGKIKQLVCLSSADMVNWTWHAPIRVDKVCSWMWNSWAPSVASREEADGKTHFYMYFSNGVSGIGVMTATSPTGPWIDPIKRPLINRSTPGIGEVNWLFDPGVVVDENGNGWLAFGGGDPNSTGTKAMPGNVRIVKLGPDMVSLGSEIAELPAPYHFEASELNIIGGKFVYSYSSSWSTRSDWSSLGIDKQAPGICSIAYMTSNDPLNPASWEYQGDMIRGIGTYAGWPGGNNHSHLMKFGDKYYMFYHMQGLAQKMGYRGGYRSISVNEANVNESTATMETIDANWAGVTPLRDAVPQASERQEAEMIWNAAGVEMNTDSDRQTYVHKIREGGWTAVSSVTHNGEELKSFTASLRGSGRLEIYLDRMEGEPAAVVNFANEDANFHEYTVDLNKKFGKQHNVFFLFSSVSGNAAFDYWQFNTHSAGVPTVDATSDIISQEYFTISGVKVEHPTSGIYIIRNHMSDGTVKVTKSAVDRPKFKN